MICYLINEFLKKGSTDRIVSEIPWYQAVMDWSMVIGPHFLYVVFLLFFLWILVRIHKSSILKQAENAMVRLLTYILIIMFRYQVFVNILIVINNEKVVIGVRMLTHCYFIKVLQTMIDGIDTRMGSQLEEMMMKLNVRVAALQQQIEQRLQYPTQMPNMYYER